MPLRPPQSPQFLFSVVGSCLNRGFRAVFHSWAMKADRGESPLGRNQTNFQRFSLNTWSEVPLCKNGFPTGPLTLPLCKNTFPTGPLRFAVYVFSAGAPDLGSCVRNRVG